MDRVLNEENWNRYHAFRRYYDENNCSISLCDDIDVTRLYNVCKNSGYSIYITLLYVISGVINSHDEFKLHTVDSPVYEAPMPAVWDRVDPVHNIFREQTDSFVSIYTLWKEDYKEFYGNAYEDIERAKVGSFDYVPSGDNVFEASCLPWRHFTSVGAGCDNYSLSPVVVWGKISGNGEKMTMPLSIQISHAAADGYHLARFLTEVEERAMILADEIELKKI